MASGEPHGRPPDPGWGGTSGRALLLGLLPYGKRQLTVRDERPPIVALRSVFISFLVAVLLLAVVLVFILPLTAEEPPSVVIVLLAASAVGPLISSAIQRRLRRICAEPDELAQRYTQTFFLAIALSETAALLGFVAAFLGEAMWPYLVGLALTLGGFATIAPTEARLRALDRAIRDRGCPHSLTDGLFRPRA